jgi:hypothetical protein
MAIDAGAGISGKCLPVLIGVICLHALVLFTILVLS